MPAPRRITFIGLGAMGGPMAARLAGDDGFEVTAYDLSPRVRQAASAFARTVDNIADAVDGAELVCTMVPADAHLLRAVADIRDIAKPGQTFIDFSTVSPGAIERAASELAAAGVEVVSASCMKSVAAARAGELSLFVGGSARALSDLAPVFGRVATTWADTGSLSAAKSLKLANNLLTAATGFCYLDGLVVATKLGCPAADAVDAIQGAGADSWTLRKQVVGHALADDLGPGIFSVAYMAKDVELAQRLAEDVGRPAFFAGLVLAGYRGLSAMDLRDAAGDDALRDAYHPVVVRWLELVSGAAPVTRVPEPGIPAGQVRELWPAMRAVQAQVVAEVLDIVEGTGLGRREAARFLQAGSAESDRLGLEASGDADLSGDAGDLRAAQPLIERAGAPALSFATALNTAMAVLCVLYALMRLYASKGEHCHDRNVRHGRDDRPWRHGRRRRDQAHRAGRGGAGIRYRSRGGRAPRRRRSDGRGVRRRTRRFPPADHQPSRRRHRGRRPRHRRAA